MMTMTRFSMSRSEAQELAESVARALNAAGIPCVVWGTLLMAIHGIEVIADAIQFVVPDEHIAAASEVYRTGHFNQTMFACPDTMKCLDGNSPDSQRPHPAFHMHIDQEGGYAAQLYLQSETLWYLPPLSASLALPRACQLPPYLALACDRTALPFYGRGPERGAFESDQSVVLVLKAHMLTEALMRIMARDYCTKRGTHVMSDFLYILRYVEKLGFLDLDLLPEPFKKIYEDFNRPPELEPVENLQRTLGIPVHESFYR